MDVLECGILLRHHLHNYRYVNWGYLMLIHGSTAIKFTCFWSHNYKEPLDFVDPRDAIHYTPTSSEFWGFYFCTGFGVSQNSGDTLAAKHTFFLIINLQSTESVDSVWFVEHSSRNICGVTSELFNMGSCPFHSAQMGREGVQPKLSLFFALRYFGVMRSQTHWWPHKMPLK